MPWFYKTITSVTIAEGITSIGDHAFGLHDELISIQIPNSITKIGKESFYYCDGLASITIPEGVKSIESEAFRRCNGLTSITIPNSVTSIDKQAFYYCDGLASITIPGSVQVLDERVFAYCSALETVELCEGVTEIATAAFSNCISLKKISIPSSVIAIATDAFDGSNRIETIEVNENNTAFVSENHVLFDKGKTRLILCAKNKTESYVIPNTVKMIEQKAFYNCLNISAIMIPEGVEQIGKFAFGYCNALESIAIPRSTVTIGKAAFSGCKNLKTINVHADHNMFYAEDGALFNKEKTTLYQCPRGKSGSYTIPTGVKNIDTYAFYYCDALTNVTIPKDVVNVGQSAFYNCNSITDIYYTGTLEDWAGVTIASGNDILSSCTIHFAGEEDTVNGGICGESLYWKLKNTGELIISGTGEMDDCEYGAPWESYKENITRITIESGVASIGASAFCECENLVSVSIPDSVTNIEEQSFVFCTNLVSASIPNGVVNIGEGAFFGTSLRNVVIPASVSFIGPLAFAGFTENYIVDTNNGVYSSSAGVLYSKDKTTLIAYPTMKAESKFNVPNHVVNIETYAFKENYTLEEIVVPSSVLSVGAYAFCDCDCLLSVAFSGGNVNIGESAFDECSELESMDLTGVYSIGDRAFEWCTSLKTIAIPDTVISMGEEVFYQCYNMENIDLSNNLTEIKNNTFWGCDALQSIVIPSGVKQIGDRAFYDCNALTNVCFMGTEGEWGAITIGSGNKCLTDIAIQYMGATVTYDYATNGGSSATKPSDTVQSGSEADLSVTATKAGWEFVGWNTDKNATRKLSSYTVTGDVTLYAIYKKTYTANFYSKNNVLQETKTVDLYNTATSGSINMPTVSTYTGWTALGWRDDTTAGTKEQSASATVSLSSNKNYYAVYQRTLTLSYNANGGATTPSTQTANQYYNANGSQTSHTMTLASAISRENYTFSGWAMGSTSGTVHKAGSTVSLTESTTMVALWDAVMYTVTYDYATNGGSSATKPSDTVQSGSEADLSVTATKAGWEFVGWNTDKNATTKLSSYTVTGDVNLYAIYKKSYIANFYSKNNVLQETKTVELYNTATSARLTMPTISAYTGWTALGWRDDTTAGDLEYNASSNITISSDKTYYGVYKRTLTLSYNVNGGASTPSAQTATQYYNAAGNKSNHSFTLADSITYAGYRFSGWALGSASGTAYNAGDSVTISDDTTMYALWDAVMYTVVYDYATNGGSSVTKPSVTIQSGSKADLSVTATKSGWKFVGWNTDKNATTALPEYTVTGDVTLYAIYKKTLTASFYCGANTLQTTKTVDIYNNAASGNITAPELTNYLDWTALGWRGDTVADAPVYEIGQSITLSKNQKFYGVYVKELTLSYNANGGINTPSAQTANQYYNAQGNTGNSTFVLANAIQNDGYTFRGWAKNSTNGIVYETGASVTVTANTVMYAAWGCTVTYDYKTNGGTNVTVESALVEIGDFADLTPTATKVGWTFLGWNTNKNATTGLSSYTVNQNTTLYAIFKQSVTVSVLSNQSPGDVAYGTEVVLSVNEKTDSYVIYYTIDGNVPHTGSHVFTDRIVIEDNMTVRAFAKGTMYQSSIASFTYTVPKFTIEYDANGGVGGPSAQTKKYGQDLVLSSLVPARDGFVFGGWSKTKSGTMVAYQPGDVYKAEANLKLFAIWKTEENNIPTVTLGEACDITATSVRLTGIVEDDGGETIINRYFVYYEKNNPNARYTAFADSNFQTTVSNLKESTEYWFYAEAQNAVGVGISRIEKFTTAAGAKTLPSTFRLYNNTITVKKGTQIGLGYSILPVTAINKNVHWTSDNVSIATVSNDGVITGVSVGQAMITGITEVGRLKQSCTVYVTEDAEVSLDFSEWNMVANTGQKAPFGWNLSTASIDQKGGNIQRALSYLTRWDGPVAEVQDMYPQTADGKLTTGLAPLYHVQDVVFIPQRANALDNDGIKNAIIKYGAVHSSYYSLNSCYNANQTTFCNPHVDGNGHAIAIVGWDDNFPAERFVNKPAGNGAFICKNSYGTDAGDSGYLYISYYDANLGIKTFSCAYSSVESTENYGKIYQYDPMGPTASSSFGATDSLWCANVFPEHGKTLTQNETLKAVSFYTISPGELCKVYVVQAFTGKDSLKTLGTPVIEQTIETAGYHTLKLKTPIFLEAGTRFAVVVQTTNSSGNAKQYVEASMKFKNSDVYMVITTAGGNESFYSTDGINFVDMTTVNGYETTNACIKAFTDSEGDVARSVQAIDNQSRELCTQNVYSVEEMIDFGYSFNADFVDAASDISLMSDTEAEEYIDELPPSIEIESEIDFLDGGTLPKAFDLRSTGVITDVKHQGAFFNCWAFASIAALESSVLKKLNRSGDNGLDGAIGEEEEVTQIAFTESQITLAQDSTHALTIKTNTTEVPKDIVYSSSDPSVVTVNTGGAITGISEGFAKITASYGNMTATCNIYVMEGAEPTTVTLDAQTLTDVKGRSLMLGYTLTPSYAKETAVVWESSDENICSVNENGVVTMHDIGTATITISTMDGKLKDTCRIQVRDEKMPGLLFSTGNALSLKPDEENKTNTLYGSVSVQIENYTTNTNGKLYVAIYDNKGKLLSMQSEAVALGFGSLDKTIAVSQSGITATDGYVKIFFWDGKNLKPLAGAAEATW